MAEKIVVSMEIEAGASQKDIAKTVKGIEGVKEATIETKEATKDLKKETSELSSGLDRMTGGAISGFKESFSGLKNLVKGTKLWKLALGGILTLGFFAIIKGLSAYFNSSEEGQNKLAKATKQFGVILGNVGDLLAGFGEIMYNVFTGNFDEAGKAFDSFKEKIANFGEETTKEIELAGELADRIAEVNKKERDLLVDRETASGRLEKLRTKAAQVDKFTSEERIRFLEEAATIESEINARQVALAQEKLDIKIAENSLSGSTKEDLDEEAQLRADVIALENQSLAVKREFYSQISGLRQADIDKRKAETEAEKAAREAEEAADAAKLKAAEEKEKSRLDSIQAIRDSFKMKIEDAEAQSEAEKLELQKQRDLEELERLGATEEQKLELKKYYAGLESDLKDKDAEAEKALNKAVKDAKVDQAKQGLAAITALAGEGSEIGKAAALASATISGIEGVQNAFTTAQDSPITTVFPAYPFIQAGIAAAFSATQIKSILAVPKPAKGGGAPSGANVPSQQPPAFNIVGAAPESQLAQTVAGKEDKPVKAYVVSNDVTTAQGLDRNIVESASLG